MAMKKSTEFIIVPDTPAHGVSITIEPTGPGFRVTVYQPPQGHSMNESPEQKIVFCLTPHEACELAEVLEVYKESADGGAHRA